MNQSKILKEYFESFGGRERLKIFLIGAGCTGKIQVRSISQSFCCNFSAKIRMMLNIKYLSCIGSATVLLRECMIYECIYLNCERVNDKHSKYWSHAIILIIDKISFLSIDDLRKLDEKLRSLRQEYSPYSIVNIVCVIYFH